MLFDDAACRQQSKKSTDRFAYDRQSSEASVPSARDHQHFPGAFCLLHSQPVLCPLYGVSRCGQRRAKIQRSGFAEAKLVESVLE
jgi:hypothetical protein